MYLVGGDSPKQAINLMLKKLMVKEFSLLFSSKGKKGKRDFSSLMLYKAIIGK